MDVQFRCNLIERDSLQHVPHECIDDICAFSPYSRFYLFVLDHCDGLPVVNIDSKYTSLCVVLCSSIFRLPLPQSCTVAPGSHWPSHSNWIPRFSTRYPVSHLSFTAVCKLPISSRMNQFLLMSVFIHYYCRSKGDFPGSKSDSWSGKSKNVRSMNLPQYWVQADLLRKQLPSPTRNLFKRP